MKSNILALCAASLTLAVTSVPAFAADATRGVITLNRHQLAAAKELEAYRLYEQATHPKVLNAGTFLIGSGGTADANNDAVEVPTKQSAPFPMAKGVDHLLIVSCDEDCLLLNVRVFDAAGKMVGQDVSPTRTTSRYMVKTVQLVPTADQSYRVETEIACRKGSKGGCSFAIGANTK
jgi:hypothetical protein